MKIFKELFATKLASKTKSLILKTPKRVLYISFIPSLIIFSYFFLLQSPKFSSQMSIGLSNSSNPAFLGGAQAFMPTPSALAGDTNIAKLKLFLESKEATTRINEMIDLPSIYNLGDIFNGYKFRNDPESLHDFRLNNFSVFLNTDSNSLVINSYAFTPKDAFNINMALLVAVNFYLNRNTRIANEIIEVNKFCELQSLRRNLIQGNYDVVDAKNLISENSLKNGSDLILRLAQNRRNNCSNVDLSPNKDTDKFAFLTSDLLLSAYEDALRSIASSRLDTWNNTDSLEIISEPNLPVKKTNSNAFLKSFAYLVLSILSIYAYTILIRIFREFEL